ncbi:nucleotidyltransferase family protein [candidate division KSB1 bacterium]|nr:nucleotidyltransferase family protein [candidate division KSB1 bacterium]
MHGVILAAGYATRLYPLTKDRPKPLLPVGGKPLLDHLLDHLSRLDEMKRIFIVTNARFAPIFADWVQSKNNNGTYPFDLVVVDDGTTDNDNRLGAIADLQFVLDRYPIQDDFLVAAGDNLFDFDFRAWINFFRQRNSDSAVAYTVDDVEKLRRSGVIRMNEAGWAISLIEKPQNPPSRWVCPALYLFKSDTLKEIRHYLDSGGDPDLPGRFIAWLLTRQPLAVYPLKEPVTDIGTMPAYEAVCRRFKENSANLKGSRAPF